MKRKAPSYRYILNPGDYQDVETWEGPASVELLGQVMPRWEDARAASPLARLYRVEVSKKTRTLYEWLDREHEWIDVEDTSGTPIKVLQAAKAHP